MASLCLILQRIHDDGPALLRAAGHDSRLSRSLEREALAGEIAGARAVLTRDARVDAALMDAAPGLEVIGVHGAGVDNVDLAAATARGILVVNTPGANARSVAEHALALVFHLAKSLGPGDRAARASDGTFKYRSALTELECAIFGVVGFGAIGAATARLARALGMEVVVWTRRPADPAVAAAGFPQIAALDDLLGVADIVSLHLPGGEGTRHLIGAAQIARMKPSALLINTARGTVVDEAALAVALREGRIGGAGLDVFEVEPLPPASPLIGLDNVVLTPHVSGSTQAALKRTATVLAGEVIAALAGRRPTHLVNPQAWTARRIGARSEAGA
ncbi:D-3-phosphoglycerate dehydrogenase [Angulomicrobium tetraedrale]|uniref:D-3-phosphoglycerate dehydrogenase n=1 Tax=Ancylobacter tetraedralis TaxID=217068 RepID=A0A839ZFA8_9HYPH|nr:hydroxyacid dehydrogenase [Ancylobacter tetraedralis]MBB3773620.1 D-3-phosphoglycerate dehydrogenase [Ancylobacter tetraedralis]